jgi:hypothetical protein
VCLQLLLWRINLQRTFIIETRSKFNKHIFILGDDIRVSDKYTMYNDDGSITWGYQSEDGSFKEETVGIDCVTRGR